MSTTILIIQITLASLFALSGIVIYSFRNRLKSRLSWLSEYSPAMVRFICASKILGAAGLILPFYFNGLHFLTPLAALGLAAIMILAARYHIRKREFKEVPVTILFMILSLFIVYVQF